MKLKHIRSFLHPIEFFPPFPSLRHHEAHNKSRLTTHVVSRIHIRTMSRDIIDDQNAV